MQQCILLFSVKIMACILLTPTNKGKTFTHIKADFAVLNLPFEITFMELRISFV